MEKNEANIEMGDTSRESKGKAPLLAATVAAAAHNRGKGYKRGPAVIDVVLRVCAAAAALGAAVAMGTTEQTLPFFTQFFQFQASYEDIPTYTFFVIAMAIVTGYLFLSVPFSIVCIARPSLVGPRLLLIICDTVVLTICMAAGGSAGAIDYLAHNGNSDANWLAICQQFGDFCQRASGAVVGSLITAVLLVFLVVISAVALRKH